MKAEVEETCKINSLIAKLGLSAKRKELISNVCGGRTKNLEKLSQSEYFDLWYELTMIEQSGHIRPLIFTMAHLCGFTESFENDNEGINMEIINFFFKTHGTIKKEINQMIFRELIISFNQINEIFKTNTQGIYTPEADRAVINLLEEMNLQSSR